jgi:hypothetical protein
MALEGEEVIESIYIKERLEFGKRQGAFLDPLLQGL